MSLINEALSKAGVQVSVRREQEADCGPTGYAVPAPDRTPSRAPVARAILLSACVATLMGVLFVAVLFAWRRPDEVRAHAVVEASAPVPAVAGLAVPQAGLLPQVHAPKPPATTEPPDQHAALRPSNVAAAPTEATTSDTAVPDETTAPAISKEIVAPEPSAPMPAIEPPATVGPAVETAVEERAHPVDELSAPPQQRVDPTAGGTEALMDKTLVRSVKHPGVPALRLDGIVWSSHSPVALLNGTMVRPGDDIEGVAIKAIDRKRVQLELGGVRFYLRMP